MKKAILFVAALLLIAVTTTGCNLLEGSSPTDPKPVAVFTYNALPNLVVSFDNASTGASFYLWDFGDASGGSKDSNPVHVYATQNAYVARLTACSTSDFSDEESCDTFSAVVNAVF